MITVECGKSAATPYGGTVPPAHQRSTGPPHPGGHVVLRASVAERLRAAGCVFAEDEADVLLASTADPATLDSLVARRADGVPLEHLVGLVEFCGVRVRLTSGVFVPRTRSALLVREAAAIATVAAKRTVARPVVVDLCCGSGAIGAALAARVPGIDLYAADRDPAAVACARTNLAAPVYLGDLYAALPDALRGGVDVLVANVPYVPTRELALLPVEARRYEPRAALDGGPDGLAVLRRVAAGTPPWLAPHGSVVMEVGEAQVPAALDALTGAGLTARAVHCADLEATAVVGEAPPGQS